MITIIDSGMGNLRSVEKAFKRLNVNVTITSNPNDLENAKYIILPGVGHFQRGIENIKRIGFYEKIIEAVVYKKTPILGICLGMQMLCSHSEEGDYEGLGLINATVKKFPASDLKIPHMGWNSLTLKQDIKLLNIKKENYVYFVHSYYVECQDKEDVLFETIYGITFNSAVRRANIWGFQFHPEKSFESGYELLKIFINQ